MKLKHITHIIVAGSLLFASCDNYLDVEPKGIVIPKKYAEYDGIFNAEVFTNSVADQLIYISDDVHLEYSNTAQDPDANAYYWNPTIDINNDASPAIWGPLYRQIYNSNIVINGVLDAEGGTLTNKNHLLGEAKANRALAHFFLLTVFAKAYDASTAATLPGVPWVTSVDVTNVTPDRSTIQATIDLIINDLKEAEALLTNNRLNKTRINKAAAQAILSRVYLYIGNYDEAHRYATLALNEPHEFRDLNTVGFYYDHMFTPFPTDHFALSYVFEPYYDEEKDPEILLLRTSTSDAINTIFQYSNELLQINTSAVDEGDLRPVSYTDNWTFNGWYNRAYTGRGNYGITFMELKLTQAEALAHQDDLAGAVAILNEIKDIRYDAFRSTPYTVTNKEDIIDNVLKERRVELAFGSNRWMDMKRLAKQGRGSVSTRLANDFTELKKIDPSTFEYTFEIPSRVLMFNPNMKKNF